MQTKSKASHPVFALEGVAAGFGAHPVLHGLNWEIEAGTTFGVLGQGGHGKTLFLKVLAGLHDLIAGHVLFYGKNIAEFSSGEKADFRRRIGMTFQKGGLFDWLTTAENLELVLSEKTSLTRRQRIKKTEQALSDVGLLEAKDLPVHSLSGGMQKRLGIARALLLSPEVLLYDEPTAGLDPVTSRALVDLIGEFRDTYKMTVVLVSSELLQMNRLVHAAGFLWEGAFAQVGTMESLQQSSHSAVKQFMQATSFKVGANDRV